MRVCPYLNFSGNCKEAFELYAKILGGNIEFMQTHGDSPMAGNVPPDWKDAILHARLRIGDDLLLASDAPPDRYVKPQRFYVSLQIDTPEEADRIYNALSQNGTIDMPIQETFWAARFAMFHDRFGIPWMVDCDKPAV